MRYEKLDGFNVLVNNINNYSWRLDMGFDAAGYKYDNNNNSGFTVYNSQCD